MICDSSKMKKENTHLFSAAVVLVAFTRLPNKRSDAHRKVNECLQVLISRS